MEHEDDLSDAISALISEYEEKTGKAVLDIQVDREREFCGPKHGRVIGVSITSLNNKPAPTGRE